MESTFKELVEDIDYSGSIQIENKVSGLPAKITEIKDDNKICIMERGNYKELSFEELNENYEESDTLRNLKKDFEDGQCNLCPHEPLAALCMVVDTPDYNRDYEIVFTVPISWLLSKLNEREENWDQEKLFNWLDEHKGRNEWDQEKLFSWLNEEYVSDDSEWVWEEACLDKKIVTFNVF